MKLFIKELLILIYIFKDFDLYFYRIVYLYNQSSSAFNVYHIFGLDIKYGFFKVILYALLFIFLFIILILAAQIKNNFARYLWAVLFSFSALFSDIYQKVMHEFIEYSTFISLLDAVSFIYEATIQYFYIILNSLALASILFLGIALKPKYEFRCPDFIFAISPFFAVILLSCFLFFRGGLGAEGLPTMYPPLSYLSLFTFELMKGDIGKRQPISLTRQSEFINYDIVLIIDESIAASYLDINSPLGVKTHLNNLYNNINIYNYGYAASISNCSSATNVVLRYGGTRDNYLKTISTMPSVWTYAKKAGLSTVYIDAQRTKGKLHNRMYPKELLDIDLFIQFDNIDLQKRDLEASKKLIELINNDKHELIIVNKLGAHFPIHDKYPEQFMLYKPVLPRGKFLNISDTGLHHGFDGSPESWLRYRNSYRNTILWNVGNFFLNLFEKANLNKAVIIYTSDHGQDLHEKGNPGTNTQCSSSPSMAEGLVPLVVIKGKNLNSLDWKKTFTFNKNQSSQYNIFPTLLKMMLYDNTQIKSIYGNALDEKTDDEFTFNILFDARLGRQPKWKKIDLNKIVLPLNTDFQPDQTH